MIVHSFGETYDFLQRSEVLPWMAVPELEVLFSSAKQNDRTSSTLLGDRAEVNEFETARFSLVFHLPFTLIITLFYRKKIGTTKDSLYVDSILGQKS